MSEIKLTNTPADLREIRALLYAGDIDADQALELLRQLRQSQTGPPNDPREEIRCSRCLLNQFMTISGACRKCGVSLRPIPEPEPIMSIADTFKPLGDTMQFQISQRVRELRKLRGKSQQEISILMGCHRTYVTKIENGFILPNIKTIDRLAAAFSITPYEFMLTAEEIRRQNFLADPFIAELAADLPKLSPDHRLQTLRFASLLERQSV